MISKMINGQEKPVSNSGDSDQSNFANKTDITSIIATGATNTTGAQIPNGAYFYLNGTLCQALETISTGATFTENSNYVKTNGVINNFAFKLYYAGSTAFTATLDAIYNSLPTLAWQACVIASSDKPTVQGVFTKYGTNAAFVGAAPQSAALIRATKYQGGEWNVS